MIKIIEIKYGVPVHCVAYLTRLHCRRVRGVTFSMPSNKRRFIFSLDHGFYPPISRSDVNIFFRFVLIAGPENIVKRNLDEDLLSGFVWFIFTF